MNAYIGMYYLYLGQRVAEALKSDGLTSDDKVFCTDMLLIAEGGRIENSSVMVHHDDWTRLIKLIKDPKPRMPLMPDTKKEDLPPALKAELDAVEAMKAKINEAMKGNNRPELKIVNEEKNGAA